ncbi:flagellar hook-length control protein FliK [Leifsonia shinshuensis]|uniref:flagellar hook-length control protein FliK n=1 Tax=Leifsonia shinshuensis TaxID=150026 RepID=UPI00286B813F|nr:flagellar hook-length control protein FliK [Leifsonia shinshuensis]
MSPGGVTAAPPTVPARPASGASAKGSGEAFDAFLQGAVDAGPRDAQGARPDAARSEPRRDEHSRPVGRGAHPGKVSGEHSGHGRPRAASGDSDVGTPAAMDATSAEGTTTGAPGADPAAAAAAIVTDAALPVTVDATAAAVSASACAASAVAVGVGEAVTAVADGGAVPLAAATAEITPGAAVASAIAAPAEAAAASETANGANIAKPSAGATAAAPTAAAGSAVPESRAAGPQPGFASPTGTPAVPPAAPNTSLAGAGNEQPGATGAPVASAIESRDHAVATPTTPTVAASTAAVAAGTSAGTAGTASTAVQSTADAARPKLAATDAAASPAPIASPTPTPTITPDRAAAAQPPAPAPAASTTPSLPAQLARPVFTLAAAGAGEHVMTVHVTPDTLGPVTVRAHVGSEGVRVELFAPTDLGRDALRAILPDLRRDLSGAGLSGTLDLSSQNQPAPQHDAPSDGGRGFAGGQREEARRAGVAQAASTRSTPSAPADGSTHTIDLIV